MHAVFIVYFRCKVKFVLGSLGVQELRTGLAIGDVVRGPVHVVGKRGRALKTNIKYMIRKMKFENPNSISKFPFCKFTKIKF